LAAAVVISLRDKTWCHRYWLSWKANWRVAVCCCFNRIAFTDCYQTTY